MNQQQTGYVMARLEDCDKLKAIFANEGFDSTILQVWKEGQLWGGAKLLDPSNELHVRIILAKDLYRSFLIIDSEIEVPRDYLEHISSDFSHEPYHGPVLEILRRYGMSYEIVGNLPADPMTVKRPVRPTPWKPIAGFLGITAFFLIASESSRGFT